MKVLELHEVLPVSLDKAGSEPVTTPRIGRRYWVSVVTASGWSGWAHGATVPIIGPLHEDAEIIGFSEQHWHLDWRFASDKIVRFSPRSVVISPKNIDPSLGILRRLITCRREMVAFPRFVAPWMQALERKYAGTALKPGCLTCPHRGMPLDPATADEQGRVTCSAHGLRWNLDTGRLAP